MLDMLPRRAAVLALGPGDGLQRLGRFQLEAAIQSAHGTRHFTGAACRLGSTVDTGQKTVDILCRPSLLALTSSRSVVVFEWFFDLPKERRESCVAPVHFRTQ